MRKFFFAAIALTAMTASASAPEQIVVKLRDGACHSFAIETIERIGFTEADVVVSEKNGDSRNYPRTSVKSICYGDATKLGALSVSTALSIDAGGAILFPADAAGLGATVFAVDGSIEIPTIKLSDDAKLDGSKLAEGIHIAVLSDGRNFKFMKR